VRVILITRETFHQQFIHGMVVGGKRATEELIIEEFYAHQHSPLTTIFRRTVAVAIDGTRARLKKILIEKLQKMWSLFN
jgi:hypothetical protein